MHLSEVAAFHRSLLARPWRAGVAHLIAAAVTVGACGIAHAGDAGSGEAPLEFFMQDQGPTPIAPARPIDRPIVPRGDFNSVPTSTGPRMTEPAEFFMEDDSAWSPAPVNAQASAGPPMQPYYAPQSTASSPPVGLDRSANWAAVPMSVPASETTGFWASLDAACCACQERWVNWRCSSDYLEGCIPEGYNGLPTISMTSPSAVYSGPLNPGGAVETGGVAEQFVGGTDLARKPMSQLTTRIAVDATGQTPDAGLALLHQVPAERTHLPGTSRTWNGMTYYWDASHLIHQPLYFEDVNLERNGYSRGHAQPFVSAARFFGRLPLLPYALIAHPHYRAEYALGDARPGSPTPYVHVRPPLSGGGALFEAAVVTGLFFAIP